MASDSGTANVERYGNFKRSWQQFFGLKRHKCKGCKEEGRVSTLVPTRYGFESCIGRANLACKFRSKIIKPSNLMCFIETYREGITKISNKICSQKVTDSYESPKDTEAARLRLPVCVMW